MRGRQVKVPKTDVRPTTDMTRQALFSIIGNRLEGAQFLDLFAGSGAVGLEAWSRGARSVEWVESNKRVLAVLEENVVSLCGSADGVVRSDALQFLKRRLADKTFDIIFADPPYEQTRSGGLAGDLLDALACGGALAPGGIFVLELDATEAPAEPVGLKIEDERRYGRTKLVFYSGRGAGSL